MYNIWWSFSARCALVCVCVYNQFIWSIESIQRMRDSNRNEMEHIIGFSFWKKCVSPFDLFYAVFYMFIAFLWRWLARPVDGKWTCRPFCFHTLLVFVIRGQPLVSHSIRRGHKTEPNRVRLTAATMLCTMAFGLNVLVNSTQTERCMSFVS